ncbi:MAG: hypothetical protein ACTSWY_04735 [Promethearchaeota archaeon]
MEEDKELFCPECGKKLTENQIQDLKSEKAVYCDSCGYEFEYPINNGINISNNSGNDGQKELEEIEENVRETMEEIEEEFLDEAKEAAEEAEEEVKEVIEEAREIVREAVETARELMEEAKEYMKEAIRTKSQGKASKYWTKAKIKFIKGQGKLENAKVKAQAKIKKVQDKVNSRKVRINFSLPKDMKEDLQGWAEKLNWSVSQLLRNVFQKLGNEIGEPLEELGKMNDIKIERIGKKFESFGKGIEKIVKESGVEKFGDEIERIVKESGIEKLGEILGSKFGGKKNKATEKKTEFKEPKEEMKVDKEHLKKRVKGLIKLQGSIPIDKLAIALKKSEEFAENLIYELAAEESVEGTLEDGVFKFTTDQNKIISFLFDLIDKMD